MGGSVAATAVLVLFLAGCRAAAHRQDPTPTVDPSTIAVWADCSEAGCVGRVTCGAYATTLPAPHKPWNIDGVVIVDSAFRDVDGDGAAELLVTHQVVEPPRPAVGSWAETRLTIYNLPTLTRAASLSLGRSGAGTEPACTAAVTFEVAAESPTPALRVQTRCAGEREQLEQGVGVTTTEQRWVWSSRTDRFRRR